MERLLSANLNIGPVHNMNAMRLVLVLLRLTQVLVRRVVGRLLGGRRQAVRRRSRLGRHHVGAGGLLKAKVAVWKQGSVEIQRISFFYLATCTVSYPLHRTEHIDNSYDSYRTKKDCQHQTKSAFQNFVVCCLSTPVPIRQKH